MFKAWMNLGMLAIESQRVMLLRAGKIAAGGAGAAKEMERMVTEKLDIAASETGRLALGASPDSVVRAYRKRVRANLRRLSK